MRGYKSVTEQAVVELRGIGKTFPLNGVTACDGVDLDIGRGETLILMGENGAGKSTLASLVTGKLKHDRGSIRFAEGASAGMVHQKPLIIHDFTVSDMIFGGNRELNRGLFYSAGKEKARVRDIFAELGYALNPEDRVGQLAPYQHQLIELAENLLMGRTVLILDEPEFPRLSSLLILLKKKGITPVIITHKVEDALELGQRIILMKKGRIVLDRSAGSDKLKETVLENLLPETKKKPHTKQESSPSEGEKGQITVIVGHHESGLWDEEEKLARDYLSEDNGYIPSLNRKKAMEESWSVEENFMIHRRKSYTAPWGLLRKKSFLRDGMKSLEEYGVAARPGDRMNHLSGGNQKKLLLLREFQRSGNRILLSEPSSALDQANRDYLYNLIYRAKDEGKEVLMLTADPEEALRLGDRIIPLFKGTRGETLERGESNLAQLTALMGGSNR